MRTNFVVLSTHRSGSSKLCRLLNSHEDIVCMQEVLRTYQKRSLDPRMVLDDVFSSRPEIPAFGVKVQYSHVDSQVEDYLEQNVGVKIIQLIRNDLLETVLWYPGKYQGLVTGGLGVPLQINGTVTANIDIIIQNIKWLHKQISKYYEFADVVVFKDEVMDGGKAFCNAEVRKKVLACLCVQDIELLDSQLADPRRPSCEVVCNWDELVSTVGDLRHFRL